MLAIINGKILTMAGRTHQKGAILIEDGKIIAVGENILIPKGADVINANGKVVMPGLIDAHCHLGIVEEVYQIEGDDLNETTNPITPHLRALDGVNPEDLGFLDAARGGVTTVAIAPGSANVIGGQVMVMKTWGNVVDRMLVKEPAGLKIAFGENPSGFMANKKSHRLPGWPPPDCFGKPLSKHRIMQRHPRKKTSPWNRSSRCSMARSPCMPMPIALTIL